MTLLWLHVLIISVVHTKSKSMFSSRQHANLQRTALLYMKGGGFRSTNLFLPLLNAQIPS